ncbi:hypothetical protein TrRE_jg3923 [Triparma retinervis]|uniref:Uncharacterized protein n=1 Tax=Triparma retinervis TaxID=2557542 RepID=A0A9W7EG26_9STRA|nr:hypothetical protein TrRE_jg3923 [Triparma retinervis]
MASPHEIFTPIYDEMRSRNLANIVSPGKPTLAVDSNIAASQNGTDHRRCLALYTFPRVELSSDGANLIEALNNSFGSDPDVVLFSPSPPTDGKQDAGVWGKLHWTLMQIQGFSDWGGAREVTVSERENFGRTIESYFPHSKKIKIRMCGVIAVRTGLVIVGIPDTDINDTRDRCRARMNESPPLYPLKEPFLNDIVHSTVLRVCGGDGTGPKTEQILKIASDFKDVYLGDAYVDKLSVGEASWRMMDEELSRTPPIGNCVSVCDSDTASTTDGSFGLEGVGWRRPG